MKTFLLAILLLHSSLSFAHCREQVYEDLGHRMDLWEQRFYVSLGVGPFTLWPIAAVTGAAGIIIMVPIVATILVTGKAYNNSYLRYNISDLDGTKVEEAEMKKIVERIFKHDLKKITSEEDKNIKIDKILEIIATGNENEELCPKKLVNVDPASEEEEFNYKYLNLHRIREYVRARL